MGIPNASDKELQRWFQALIDWAGNFGYFAELFARAGQANIEINACIRYNENRLRAVPDPSAISIMINVGDPIEYSQIIANIKIAIGGGINEPSDALLTILYGLLTNPGQLAFIKETEDWELAFQEGVRWVAVNEEDYLKSERILAKLKTLDRYKLSLSLTKSGVYSLQKSMGGK